jgi:hypothetical protein
MGHQTPDLIQIGHRFRHPTLLQSIAGDPVEIIYDTQQEKLGVMIRDPG